MNMTKMIANYRRLVLIAAIISLMSLLFAGCGDDKYVEQIKSGHLNINTNASVGKAFDQYFSDGEWKSFKTDSGERVVEFNGGCRWNDKPATICVQFTITSDTEFQITYLDINGRSMNVYDSLDILDKVISSAKK